VVGGEGYGCTGGGGGAAGKGRAICSLDRCCAPTDGLRNRHIRCRLLGVRAVDVMKAPSFPARGPVELDGDRDQAERQMAFPNDRWHTVRIILEKPQAGATGCRDWAVFMLPLRRVRF